MRLLWTSVLILRAERLQSNEREIIYNVDWVGLSYLDHSALNFLGIFNLYFVNGVGNNRITLKCESKIYQCIYGYIKVILMSLFCGDWDDL